MPGEPDGSCDACAFLANPGNVTGGGIAGARSGPAAPGNHSMRGGTMTTAGPAAQASTTVNAQDARVFSIGQQASGAQAHAVVPGLGNVTATTVTLQQGSSSQELLVVIQGLNLTTATPTVVLVQPRQSVNQNQGFSDEFVTQVIATSKTQIQVLVRRVDTNSGWGQHLRLDLFIVD
jgi:hypothetical protein